ncbi:MAG: hypothetical protein IH616_23455 [Gemmatimonadales bacterium]|jgi:hypothetical protein|nr:hypothetical protein [Gemmatimonadales bacterium]
MLRHCTIGELLELRDGEGTAAARSHVDTCEPCRAELDRLYQRTAALRALPAFHAPRDRWPVVQDALGAQRRRARLGRYAWASLAAAAVLAGFIGVRSIPHAAPTGLAAQEVETLVGESQQLEALLHSIPRQGRVVNGATAAAIAALEDRIALVDRGIARAQAVSMPEESMADLWRERVVLMDQLVDTHVRQVAYVGY